MNLDIANIHKQFRFPYKSNAVGLLGIGSLSANQCTELQKLAAADPEPTKFARKFLPMVARKIGSDEDLSSDKFTGFPQLTTNEANAVTEHELLVISQRFIGLGGRSLVLENSESADRLMEGDLKGLLGIFQEYSDHQRQKMRRFARKILGGNLIRQAEMARETAFSRIESEIERMRASAPEPRLPGEVPVSDYQNIDPPEFRSPILDTNELLQRVLSIQEEHNSHLSDMNHDQAKSSRFTRITTTVIIILSGASVILTLIGLFL